MKHYRVVILGMVLVTIMAFFASGFDDYLTLESIKSLQGRFDQWFADAPWLVAGGFFLVYVLIAAFSLPGATLLTLLGKAGSELVMERFLGASRPGGISLFRQGLLLWDLLPNIRKDRLEPLMKRFGEILRQHTLFTHILGVL